MENSSITPFLTGHVACVTGASRGIGAAIARRLAACGAKVALAARSAAPLEQLANEIQALGGCALAIPTDLERDSDLTALILTTVNELGSLSILVNNAGLGLYGPIETFSTPAWDQTMRINARAPFILSREAIPHLRRAAQRLGDAALVNISSVVGIKGYVRQAAYTASKHALMGFSKVLAQELQPDAIRVHTLCPGGVDTDMVTQARPDLDRSQLIRPDEIAQAVEFLLRFGGRGIVDDLHIRRRGSAPWF